MAGFGANRRLLLNALLDAMAGALAAPLARWLALPGEPVAPAWLPLAGAAAVLLAGLPFGLSRQYWRFAGILDLAGVAASAVLAAALLTAGLWTAGALPASPAFPAIHALVLMAAMAAPRVAYRARGLLLPTPEAVEVPTALLAGAGDTADLLLQALTQDRRQPFRVIGLLALRERQTGRRIHGQPILGTLADAPAVLDRLAAEGRLPSMLVVTTPEIAGAELQTLLDVAEARGVSVRQAPRPTALTQAGPKKVELRPIAIEDLLNRPQVALDREGMARLVQGRRVLVTGAGGTIGSELARQVAALGPATLFLLDNGEYALWQIEVELAETHPSVPRRAAIADIRDAGRIAGLMAEWRPELVFHAAALKHVPIVEAHPTEGVLTNALGTRHVADAAAAVGAAAMVLISTDKAVNPTSVMGATKRLAEMYCQALDMKARAEGRGMRCVTVRFGNVLGSTGSVVPLFQRQLAQGGPLTVTHPDMRRYFMTVREAVGLVLQACVAAEDPARLPAAARQGGLFVLDMGEPVKIVDLARQVVRLAGLVPDRDVEIRFTGLRPGEKLFEELFHGQEPPLPTDFPGLLMATPRTGDPAIIGRAIDEAAAAGRRGDAAAALRMLANLVPEFTPDAAGSAQA